MKLIILNGPCGVGKSTVALEIQKELPLSLLLDVDALRRTIEGYQEHRKESLQLSYRHAIALAESNLGAGQSVVVEKTVFNDDWFLEGLKDIARAHQAEYFEFLLTADRETVVARAEARGFRPGGMLTPERVGEFWEESQTFAARRPEAIVVDTTALAPEDVITFIKEQIF